MDNLRVFAGWAVAVLVCFTARASPASDADVDSSLSFIREHRAQLKTGEAINDRLFQPAMSTAKDFLTFDGNTAFKANLVCSSEAPVVRVTALPVGSIGGVGELNIKIEYDRDLDGILEGNVTVHNVAGMCGNGLIKDCSPSGSWRNCRYCRWSMESGSLQAQCDYGGSGGSQAPIGPQGLQGCFCFNASCGSPTLSMMETILSFAATGIHNILRSENNTLAITKSDYKSDSMQLSYIGARSSNCSEYGNDATLSQLTALQGKFEFPTSDAIRNAEHDPDHPYNLIAQRFRQDGSTYHKCIIESKLGVETKEFERKAPLDFGIGVDANGSSRQCYWFRGGYCGGVYGETGNLGVCISRIIPAALSDLCYQMFVNSGSMSRITNISDYRATSGVSNYIPCYGSEDDWADQLWTVTCWGMRLDDSFVCKSPSMSLPGQIIHNENSALFQGCTEIHEPTNTCAVLEKRRADGECQLQTELVDGVYTIRDGAISGLEPASSCKTLQGTYRGITVCEPWWRRDRIYRCKEEEADFSKVKERALHIGNTIGYDVDTNRWASQGDLTWQGENKSTRVFDPNLEFMPAPESCLPGCRVRKAASVTDIFVPGQGKVAADGSYHMASDGQLSTTVNRNTVVEYIKECDGQNKAWTCPLEEGESMVTGCQCFDKDSFGEVIGTLQAINMASTNMICSTGTNVGICTPETQGVQTQRVVCGDYTASPSGGAQLAPSSLQDCQPKLWRGTETSGQTHRVEATENYDCMAYVPGYPGDDHFDNNLGPLTPVSAWFDQPVSEAGSRIIQALTSDPRFRPAPGPNCSCGDFLLTDAADGSASTAKAGPEACTWSVSSTVNDIRRQDELTLRPESQDPFGNVFLSITRVGSWRETGSVECSQTGSSKWTCPIRPGALFSSLASCAARCKMSVSCPSQSEEFRFKITIRNQLNDYRVVLDMLTPESIPMGSWAYPDEGGILQQCVDRYTQPNISFIDPATNGKFEVAPADALIYQLAAERGEAARDSSSGVPNTLPKYPPTYRPQSGKVSLPNTPMYWDKRAVAVWTDDDTLRIGYATLNFSGLVPSVYYYTCPTGAMTSGNGNTCGAVAPFGGIDWTVQGLMCFQHRCDPGARIEPDQNLGGCGMANDGSWQ